MGFFSFLETLFFISLAITFVLIIMLVYHFKGRLVLLEQKTSVMFEMMTSIIKEMKDIRNNEKTMSNMIDSLQRFQNESLKVEPTVNPVFSSSIPFGGAAGGLFPPELFRLFQTGDSRSFEKNEYDSEDEEVEELKKIVVSDTEMDSDEEDDDDVRIISVDMDNSVSMQLSSLDDLQEVVLDAEPDVQDLKQEDVINDEEEVINDEEQQEEQDEEQDEEKEQEEEQEEEEQDEEQQEQNEEQEEEEQNEEEQNEPIDYRKLDVSYLRTMVITRGLATDTKKLKKSDLIRLLEG